VVVISDGLWRRKFGADPALVGRTLRLSGEARTVVGIMPPGFELIYASDASVPSEIDVWRPFGDDVAKRPRDLGFLRMIGRLKPGVRVAEAQAELDGIAAALRSEFREYGTPGLALTVGPLHGDAVRETRPILLALFFGVGMVTLIACANVANLLLARATRREREISLRAALGATRGRLVRQLLTESLLVAFLGGVAGLAVGWGALRLLLALRPATLSRVQSAGLSPSVIAFTFAITAAAGILSGLAPIASALRRSLSRGFQERGPAAGAPRGQRALVLAEVALGFVLLAGSGLMVRTFVGLLRADPGFRPSNVLTFQVGLAGGNYPDDAAGQRFFRTLRDEVRAVPGVESAGAVSTCRWTTTPTGTSTTGARALPRPSATRSWPTIARSFPATSEAWGSSSSRDATSPTTTRPGRPNVIVVDESLARRTWPGESALGKRLEATFIHEGSFDPTVAEVVGVVRHVRDHSLAEDGRGQIYVSYLQSAREKLAFTVRTAGDPQALAGRRARGGRLARPRPRGRQGPHARLLRRRGPAVDPFRHRGRRRARRRRAPPRVRGASTASWRARSRRAPARSASAWLSAARPRGFCGSSSDRRCARRPPGSRSASPGRFC
jgi:putative ABC transport system permease protein